MPSVTLNERAESRIKNGHQQKNYTPKYYKIRKSDIIIMLESFHFNLSTTFSEQIKFFVNTQISIN